MGTCAVDTSGACSCASPRKKFAHVWLRKFGGACSSSGDISPAVVGKSTPAGDGGASPSRSGADAIVRIGPEPSNLSLPTARRSTVGLGGGAWRAPDEELPAAETAAGSDGEAGGCKTASSCAVSSSSGRQSE